MQPPEQGPGEAYAQHPGQDQGQAHQGQQHRDWDLKVKFREVLKNLINLILNQKESAILVWHNMFKKEVTKDLVIKDYYYDK